VGESKRRKSWRESMDAFTEDSNGMFQAVLIPGSDVLGMLVAALEGDKVAAARITAVKQILGEARTSGPLCGCCDHEFVGGSLPEGFIFATPNGGPNPRYFLAVAVCRECMTRGEEDVYRRKPCTRKRTATSSQAKRWLALLSR
jgi:hypothetical protein